MHEMQQSNGSQKLTTKATHSDGEVLSPSSRSLRGACSWLMAQTTHLSPTGYTPLFHSFLCLLLFPAGFNPSPDINKRQPQLIPREISQNIPAFRLLVNPLTHPCFPHPSYQRTLLLGFMKSARARLNDYVDETVFSLREK